MPTQSVGSKQLISRQLYCKQDKSDFEIIVRSADIRLIKPLRFSKCSFPQSFIRTSSN